MLTSVNTIKALLANSETDSELYREHLLAMEDFLNTYKKEIDYKLSPLLVNQHNHLLEKVNSRLEHLRSAIESVKANPMIGMRSLLDSVYQNFQKWLYENQFGYLSDFQLTQSGIVKIKLTTHTFAHWTNGDLTKQEVYEEEVKALAKKGFELCKGNNLGNDLYFIDSDVNRRLFESEFSLFNASAVNFETTTLMSKENRTIRYCTFRANIQDLLSLTTKSDEHRTALNQDDFDEMRKELVNFVEAFNISKKYDSLRNLCVGTMIGCLSFICRKLNVQTQTLIDYDAENEEIRRKNQECRALETKIAKLSNFEGLKDFIKERLEPLEELIEKHDFYMSEFYIDRFGQAHLTLRPSCIGFERFKQFEIVQITEHSSDLEIIDSEVNKQLLEKLLPFSELETMEIKMRNGNRCIIKVNYCVPYFI